MESISFYIKGIDVHEFFLFLAIVLLAARLFAEVLGRMGIPGVMGELLAGVLIGPTFLGWIQPDETLKTLAEIGIILLLFEVGMDTDVFRLARTGSKPIVVAILGVALPMLGGYSLGHYMLGLDMLPSLFVAGTLTATSIGITVRVLDDVGQRRAHEAQIVLGAAVLDDVLGVLILAFLYQFATKGAVSMADVGGVALYIFLFMLLSPIVGKAVGTIINHFDRKSSTPGLLLTMALALIMIFSWLAHVVGAPEIMGGFAAGIAMSQHFHVSLRCQGCSKPALWWNRMFAPRPEMAHRLEEQVRPLIHTFTPVFFVMIGVSIDFRQIDFSSGQIWLITGGLLVVAILGKLLAGFFIAENRLRQTLIGVAMIPRGEVGLIFAQIGFSQHILSPELYASLLLVIAVTTVLPLFVLKWMYGKYSGHPHLTGS